MARRFVFVVVFVAAVATAASGATYRVSPGGPISSLKSIVNTLQPGDVVEIEPGTYNEVMRVLCNGTADRPITIRGVGRRRPVFDATGQNVNGVLPNPRAAIQIEGANIILENIEITNARNGHNGSGIRLLYSTNAVVRDVKISWCDMGMMGGDRNRALIEGCDIGYNGTAGYNGYSHNMYMSGAGSIVVRGSHIHDALYGLNFKSRAHYTELWYNWIEASNEGEVSVVDGGSNTTRANSNLVMVGNVVVSKPNRTGNSSKYVNFGSDGRSGRRNGTAYVFNNTMIARSVRNDFFWITDAYNESNLVARNNLMFGSDDVLVYLFGSWNNHEGDSNWMPQTANVPSNFADSELGTDPGVVHLAGDFHLLDGSTAATSPAWAWRRDRSSVRWTSGPTSTSPSRRRPSCWRRGWPLSADVGGREADAVESGPRGPAP
ncbi:MAG: right-handed parallel beta-helix repeat-containing protein [Planctomycetota bacterium]|jgi:hypothetical protein